MENTRQTHDIRDLTTWHINKDCLRRRSIQLLLPNRKNESFATPNIDSMRESDFITIE